MTGCVKADNRLMSLELTLGPALLDDTDEERTNMGVPYLYLIHRVLARRANTRLEPVES